jgi:tRNA pseudouridine55 synthase
LTAPQSLNGVLAVDKPVGLTSRDVVNHVQKLIRPDKVGHTGTLDPLATGVLLLAIGKATRLVEYAHFQRKSYEADFQLGAFSDTLDVEGQVTQVVGAEVIDQIAWQTEMSKWLGTITQIPPAYSACKVNGKRAHELARQGVQFELASRQVTIHHLELIKFEYPLVTMRIQCSSGTYIRRLGDDMARALGSAAVMSRLVRTQVGLHRLECSVGLEQLQSRESVASRTRPLACMVDALPQLQVDIDDCRKLRNGIRLNLTETIQKQLDGSVAFVDANQSIAAVDHNAALVAIVELREDQQLHPVRVFLE